MHFHSQQNSARLAGTVVSIAVGSLLVGAGAAINLQLAFLIVVALGCLAALAAPPSAWAASALVAALTFKGLVSIGLLPSVATFLDLPLSWGALAIALSTRHHSGPLLRRHMRWIALLGVAVILAWLFNPSEVLRPVVYLMLLGEPFAVVGALIVCPPTPRMRAVLEKLLLALVIIQIPFAYFELIKLGPADRVQGTLYGAGAGAHVMSAVVVVGIIWIIQGGGPRLGAWRLPLLIALAPIPFFADAKQVIVALPIIVLASSWRHGSRLLVVVRTALALVAIILLFTVIKAGAAAQRDISQTQQGQGGKEAAALFVWRKLSGDWASLAFGKGPAETVSRAAFLTTPQFQRSGFQNSKSPLATLGLSPAPIAVEAQTVAFGASRGGTSLNTGVSSTLGVIGDLGLFGAFAYFGLLVSLFLALRRESSADAVAAASGFVMFALLGLFFDWWEQPPFGVFLGVLAGLALSRQAERKS